ncbi:DUF3224 domain-containing protein [Streptomyces coeruleorubidus]|uniref:DUF3224 domain-containing protein n=1 Tax=Streptomyces coeruleorubidus TaxID=116188 RepID=A0A5J6I3X8_STRC4|nr:DUF3224 domain-containing protein [Streptomyces coeruleorubidus]QEV26222.1 DUF3224 domain-containing protein [Streptomyces coeruleorubidus]GGT76109.1 hypothetical protein GCM10010256_38660 [Streptomyces coeruleorubidus]
MPATRTTTGHFTFADWQEHVIGPGEEANPRLAHASVRNTFSGGIEAAGTICEYTIVYVTQKTGSFAGIELITGRLDGREGSFAVEERGWFGEDGAVHCTFEVVRGSGSGELAGLRGKGGFTAHHGETTVAYRFEYEVE